MITSQEPLLVLYSTIFFRGNIKFLDLQIRQSLDILNMCLCMCLLV